MSGVRFGDLIDAGREDLAAAGHVLGDLRAWSVAAAAREAGRIARTRSGYLADALSYDVVEALTNPTLDDRARVVVDARQSLRTAAATLRRAVRTVVTGQEAQPPDRETGADSRRGLSRW